MTGTSRPVAIFGPFLGLIHSLDFNITVVQFNNIQNRLISQIMGSLLYEFTSLS